MILAALCAAAMFTLLLGVFLGWHMRGTDVDGEIYRRGFFHGVQWSRQRRGLDALARVYRSEEPWR